MSMTVNVPDDLAGRLAAQAAERGMTPEALAVEAIEAHLPATGHRLGFVALGRSGRGDLSERHKEIRRELIAERRAREA